MPALTHDLGQVASRVAASAFSSVKQGQRFPPSKVLRSLINIWKVLRDAEMKGTMQLKKKVIMMSKASTCSIKSEPQSSATIEILCIVPSGFITPAIHSVLTVD